MKRWIAVLVVMLAVVPTVARADDASKQAKVKELFATMRMDHMLDQMMRSIQGEVKAMAQETPGAEQLTPAQQKLMQDFMDLQEMMWVFLHSFVLLQLLVIVHRKMSLFG